MRAFARSLVAALTWLVASAHVGSPDIWFDGNAGPYRVTVQVELAGVVPGVAQVFVRILGDQAQRVTIQANKFDATGGAPPPEIAERVEGDRVGGLFAGKLWIMSGGSNSVTVEVSGAKGTGKVVVPVVVAATRRLELDATTGIGLSAIGLFLFVGLVTIVGAAVRESALGPGEAPSGTHRKRARVAMAITAVVGAALLFGGWKWWNAEDSGYVRRMFRPLDSKVTVETLTSGAVLNFAIVDSAWVMRGDSAWLNTHRANAWTPLVEDHGKLMHLFLIRDDLSAMAHLHPRTDDSVSFLSKLPPTLPPGIYRVFADIVHESGFAQTMVSSLALGKVSAQDASGSAGTTDDPDDSWFTSAPDPGASTVVLGLGGPAMAWEHGDMPIVAGEPAALRFVITNSDGSPATLEPYMGMAGHAVVTRDDGSVFVHIHPMGTISIASQMAFEMRQPSDTLNGMLGKRISETQMPDMTHGEAPANVVSFPYAFPKPGRYVVWVQVKQAGRIFTGAFIANVA
ncbi:MAG: hypothetical protein ABR543_16625 [Gemmatimonadaceae bacterium]